MPRYIDADLCKMIGGTCIAVRLTSTGEIFPVAGLDEIPTADVVEVVRCKDCKHFAGEGMYCAWDIIVHYDHFYCYHAERRTDETD